MRQDEDLRALLPSSRAFVLQFRADTQIEARNVAGRIEHVASGQVTHFESIDEFLAFIARMLQEDGTPADGEACP